MTPVRETRLLDTFRGVVVPTCEFMWSILLFVRFGVITAQAGLLATLGMMVLCAVTVGITTSSVSAIAANGVPRGGVHAILDRSLGVGIGGAITTIYYIGVVILIAVELQGSGRHIIMILLSSLLQRLSGNIFNE